jgi:hypothetical protein
MKGNKNGDRHKKLVQIGEPGDCWGWLGYVNPRTGYGKKQWHGETWLAHRWVWTMLFGSIPKGFTIDHLCRNRMCVNPHHLELVPQAENCRRGKGTKLTAEQVREIKETQKSWGDRKVLAQKFGVSEATISDIRSGKSWQEI